MTVERIVFLDSSSADQETAMSFIAEGDYEGAINFLEQWHYPGEHETSDEPGHGSADDVHHSDGYILSWNEGLEYVSLEYEIED